MAKPLIRFVESYFSTQGRVGLYSFLAKRIKKKIKFANVQFVLFPQVAFVWHPKSFDDLKYVSVRKENKKVTALSSLKKNINIITKNMLP